MKLNTPVRHAPAFTHEGTRVSHLNPEQQLRRTVLANMLWEDSFYEDGQTVADRIKSGVAACNPEKVAKIAVEAREKMHLRHVPLLLVREMARLDRHKALVADTLSAVIQRPDELTEFLAIYWKDDKDQSLSAQVKRGLARAFGKFNEYSLAKYDRDGAIKLRDVLRLVRPTPKDEAQAALWKRVKDRTLSTPDTWEVELSASTDKHASWTRLLSGNKLGALALLRNLRNMREAKVDDSLIKAALASANPDKVLPFRFVAAARFVPVFEPELEALMFKALAEQPKLKGKTALVVDTSPSMWMAKISAKSDMDRFDAAAALAVLCREVCEDVRVYAFNEKGYEVPGRRGFALRDALAATKGNASCGGLAVDMANKEGYDRIIVLTDGQWHVMGHDHLGRPGYREDDAKKLSPAPLTKQAYMINVSTQQHGVGYGQWRSIDGWSEAIISYIQQYEQAGLPFSEAAP